MDISERIKQRRLTLNLTLEDVASELGVAKSTVLRYETKDIHNMGIDKVESLSKVLKCTPAYLMGWEDDDITTIAAHHDNEEWTEEELLEIEKFKEFVKMKRKQ